MKPKTNYPRKRAAPKDDGDRTGDEARKRTKFTVDEHFWELSGNRRVTITEYAGKTMINIREFYLKDGQSLPGKKGISLTVEQFEALVRFLPEVQTALKARVGTKLKAELEAPAEVPAEAAAEKKNPKAKKDSKGGAVKEEAVEKKNFEATSEEEELALDLDTAEDV
ncbi:MAG: hypothetical protein M1829_004976 [Trizodia sp. TS-e1964]|nr:MAG: hypothetical protein M1829_004976 [Trizodia sp. TS-e1964]